MLSRTNEPAEQTYPAEVFAPRQAEVLETALALLVEGGEKALTTARLARTANCSKESLYKWFGDRDGLLAAMISYQASKVREPAIPAMAMSVQEFRRELENFAADLLTVLAGPTSLALNRLAIGQASREGSHLGDLLVTRGRRAIEERALRLLQAGKAAGHFAFADRSEAFEALYGLIVGELHVRMLLGEEVSALRSEEGIRREAKRAIDQFHRLYATGSTET